MSPHTRHLLHIHLAVLLFGFAGLFGKLLDLPPMVLVFGRVVFASAALLPAALWWRKGRGMSCRSLAALAALGTLLAVHWTTFFLSVQASSVAVALITFSTFPVFVVFLEPLFFRERLHAADVLLAAVAMGGIVILTPSIRLGDRITQGVLWGIASGLTFALLSLLNRRYVRRLSSLTIALYQDAFAALSLLPFVVAERLAFSAREVLLLAVLGVVCTALAHALFIAGLRTISARTASMIACLEPVYGTIFAFLLLGEVPSWRTLLGGSIVLAVAVSATVRASSASATAA